MTRRCGCPRTDARDCIDFRSGRDLRRLLDAETLEDSMSDFDGPCECPKPCPFPSCGSTDVELSSYTEMRMVVGEEPTHRFQAVCRACGARGPRIASHDGGSAERDAIATWNRRSLPTGTAAPAYPRPQFLCPGRPDGNHDFGGHPVTKPDTCRRCGARWTGTDWIGPALPPAREQPGEVCGLCGVPMEPCGHCPVCGPHFENPQGLPVKLTCHRDGNEDREPVAPPAPRGGR